MSRRKQAKPKLNRRSDDEMLSYDHEDSSDLALTTDEIITGPDIEFGHENGIKTGDHGSLPDGDDGSNRSERSTSETPPTPNNDFARHECSFCDLSFGSFFLLKQHEQENHAHLMPFKCKFCAKGFKHKRSHDRHEKSHSGIRRHKCTYCGQAFFRSDHLKLHLKTHETSKYAFVCVLCQRGFNSSTSLDSHMHIHEKQDHSKFPPIESSPSESMQIRMSTNASAYEIIGDRTTAIVNSYPVNSLQEATPKEKLAAVLGQVQCSVCSAFFKTPEHLLRHMDSDHRILKSGLESPSSLSTAKLTPSLSCPYCPIGALNSEEALELHLQAVHGADLNSNGSGTPVDRKWMASGSAYGCGICGQAFNDIGLLQKHTLHSHTLKDLDGDSFDGSTIRMTSNKPTNVRHNLLNASDPTYDCQLCGRTFDSILALHGHCNNMHGGLPDVTTPTSLGENIYIPKSPFRGVDIGMISGSTKTAFSGDQLFQCGQCDGVFTDLGAFSAHMRQHVQLSPVKISSQDQRLNCDVCGARFQSEAIRDYHLTTHYLEKESQFNCTSCAKSFPTPDELQKHLLDIHAIHMYRCSLCKDTFESRVDIQVHFAVEHSDELVRFRCRSCNAQFQSEDQFNTHVQAVHLRRRSKSSESRSNSTGGEKMDYPGGAFDLPHIGGGQASFCCPFCGEAFSVEYLYEKHLEHAHRAQMEMFMLNEFIPKSSVSQLLNQAMKFKFPISQGQYSADNEATTWNNGSNIATSSHTISSSTIIKCNICDRRCESTLELAEHKLQHCKVIHSQNCNFCHEPINSIVEFHAHIRQHNPSHGIPTSCIVCKQSLISAVDMETHAKFHLLPASPKVLANASSNVFYCVKCGKQISDLEKQTECSTCAAMMDNHPGQQRAATSNGSSSICKCEHCNLKFETLEERNSHVCPKVSVSTSQTATIASPRLAKPYQCIKCQKSFATEMEIQAHVTTHVLQDGIHHYCMLCKQVFDSPSKLQCHLIEHSFAGCSEMQCYLCNAIFSLPQPLQQHMLTKHRVDERPYECPFPQCEQKFFFRAELENHSFVHQSQKSKTKDTDEFTSTDDGPSTSIPITCPNCGVSVSNVNAYNTHLVFCGTSKYQRGFNSNSGSFNSRPTTTENSALVTQSLIGSFAKSPEKVETRSAAKSSGSKDVTNAGNGSVFCCPHCSKSFQSLSALQGHSHVHMVSKNHQCTKCRKTFPTAGKLRNHQRQHSGDKPFPCTMCMRFFSRKDNLKVHMRIHYKQSNSSGSPAIGNGNDSNGDFPTMVPPSNYLASLSRASFNGSPNARSFSSQLIDNSGIRNDSSGTPSDSSNTPFEFSGAVFGNGGNDESDDTNSTRKGPFSEV